MDLEHLLARAKALMSSMTTAQLATLALSFVLVVGVVVGSAWWLKRPSYVLLFSDMDGDAAGEMVSRLKTMKVPYQLDEGGRGIRVPASRLDELRLELSAQGLPASGRIGFEIFDRTAFGATEFMEQINYRRALEGEIARTIATLSEVTSARVHIAMGKDALFGESRPAKASVVLKLRGQRALSVSTVSGISNLVAASVEGLRPEAVVILDSFGRPLLRPDGDSKEAVGALQVERQQKVEGEMATRVVALLEPVVGVSRVRVNVAVRLDPKSSEETEERWDPNSVVRSKQTSADVAGPAGGIGGVAGARGNAPPPAVDPKAPPQTPPALVTVPGALSTRNAETTNYEVSRMTRHTIQPSGNVARLSVAVIIDDNQVSSRGKDGQVQVKRTPRKPEDLQKLHGIVAAAVGFDAERGDLLTIENVSFEEVPTEEGTPPSTLQTYSPQIWEGVRILAIATVGIIALLFVIRPIAQRSALQTRLVATAVGDPLPGGAQALRTVTDMEKAIEAQLDASADTAEARKLPVLARRATALGNKDPENVAKVLRGWMSEPGR